ncbi:thiamine pyrophosphate-binding protein [Rhodopseudomonas sp. HC1]|uniref:thiamine pyrophosphate-binding protein n=1 Tax=Rhodopseudomonas infernalis TaxID=2897386 RepID=UPI001EE9A318|nr:thiamine pyrophosphate-binding protein [Rhodopseudomonas infernalis]MCG6205227.1 thiamine pyrophosphate-binding protein [Rhodopseudomonas infernalis]
MNVQPSAGSASPTGARLRSGGEILVAALRSNGVDRMFGVPGESALPVFDALADADAGVRFIVCRHEATASHMAEADGKLTGRPGVCIVSRGPGAMHAMVGVHTAWQDSTPLLLLIGQVPRAYRGREAFQEVDYTGVLGGMTKWVAEVESAEQISEMVAQAFAVAMQGRPGPVALSLPEDVLSELSAAADAAPVKIDRTAPFPAQMQQVRALLQQAQRPLIVVGNLGWSNAASETFRRFVMDNDLPVVAGFRSQDVLDNDCEQYLGDLSLGCSRKLVDRVKQADCVLVIGDRLGDVTTQHYSLFDLPAPQPTLIHVFPEAGELGKVYTPSLAIEADASLFIAGLADLAPLSPAAWTAWRAAGRDEYVAYQQARPHRPPLDLAEIISHLRDRLPSDTIVTNGAGNYTIWLHRYFRYRQLGTQIAPKSGSMGYGLPAALAAKLRHPDRTVVCLAGDGCFMMASQEFATAFREQLPIIVIIVNNVTYGSIRMHQENQFPGRPSGTALNNPDFVALAQSYGAYAEAVQTHAAFPPALERAIAAERPSVIELHVDPRLLTPDRLI